MSRRNIYIALGLVLVACAISPAVVFAGYNLLYFVQEQMNPQETATATGTQVPALATVTPTPTPVCGGPTEMFILLIGSDSRAANYSAGLADSIRVVRVDFVDPGLTYLIYQRDLYVEIPGISEHGGITHGKLNQAYFYGNPALDYNDGPGEGPGLLALTLEHNFGARVDHYVALHLQAFERVVDQLGGLDLNLPYTVDGRAPRSTDQDRYFPAGSLHLDGYRTMLLARMRPNGDIERSRTQNLILQAFAAELLSPSVIPKLPGLAENLYGSVQTDLGPADIAALLCLGALIEPTDIQGLEFPEGLLTATRVQDPVLGNTFIWDADVESLRQFVELFNEGRWSPALPPTPEP